MAQGGQKSWSTFKQPHVLSTKARQRINHTWITKSFSIKKMHVIMYIANGMPSQFIKHKGLPLEFRGLPLE